MSLVTVVDEFREELDQLESIFAMCKGHRTVEGYVFPYTPTEDGCLVSLWDAWNRFLRSLVMESAAGPTSGLDGVTYTPAHARSEQQVIADLLANKKGHDFKIVNDEPAWSNPVPLADIVTFLGLANGTQITDAVGSSFVSLGSITVANPLKEIRICRNFVAHKSGPTLRDLLAFASPPFVDLSNHLRERRSGVEAFSEWKDCLVALAESAGA